MNLKQKKCISEIYSINGHIIDNNISEKISFDEKNNSKINSKNKKECNFSGNKKTKEVNKYKKVTSAKEPLYNHLSKTATNNKNKTKKICGNEIEIINEKIKEEVKNKLKPIQEEFLKNINKLYKENYDNIETINKTYNYNIYKFSPDSDISTTTENSVKYNQLVNDRKSKLLEIENEFLISKNSLLVKYGDNLNSLKKEIIENLKRDPIIIKKLNSNIKQKHLIVPNNLAKTQVNFKKNSVNI